MSETEAKDVTTEQPTAEDLKGVKRAAEVRDSLITVVSDSVNVL